MVTIRANWGSKPVVKLLFAYDPAEKNVLVHLQYGDGLEKLRELRVNELEALDENGRYLDIEEVLHTNAEFIL